MTIRPIDPDADSQVELVATRMRKTLIEVLGEEVGGQMYSLEWLCARVLWHLDPSECTGEVFLAYQNNDIVGHTIVRLETDEDGTRFGLFSTFYVLPEFRSQSVATELVAQGENWFRSHAMNLARTYTAENNIKLHNLMFQNGYQITFRKNDMVALTKVL